ncbi:hypothetical protein [Streptomyces sp. NBC_01235]|uniref:hypothetical protein n=1 Tax=Streptomyces sp. NBC_01235 TaxID=2903788 RepID=UPI002E111FE3|nr:hypothetical protein OG289_32800 [Streptomyces sp. NBC_01235]
MAVDLSFYKSYLAEDLREEGREEGRVRGRAQGRLIAHVESVLIVLQARGIDVSEEVRERITGCADPEMLRHWLGRAITATSVAGIFGDEQAS